MNIGVAAAGKEEDLRIDTVVEYEGTRIAASSTAVSRSLVKDTVSLYLPEEMPWGIHTWTPEQPELYDLMIRIRKGAEVLDEVRSYFGMREIRIEEGNILLNGTPLYERLILDQGYWKDSHLTPPDEQALIDDIDKIHALGFNGNTALIHRKRIFIRIIFLISFQVWFRRFQSVHPFRNLHPLLIFKIIRVQTEHLLRTHILQHRNPVDPPVNHSAVPVLSDGFIQRRRFFPHQIRDVIIHPRLRILVK